MMIEQLAVERGARRRARPWVGAVLAAVAFGLLVSVAHAQTEGEAAPAATEAPAEASALAEASAPKTPRRGGGWHAFTVFESRFNPIGPAFRMGALWKVPLFPDAENMLLRGAYVEAGLAGQLSPGSIHPGLLIKVVPILPLEFRFSAQHLRYFGLFGTLAEYDSIASDWSPKQRREAWDQDLGRHETGYKLTAQAVLKLKFGPVVGFADARHRWVGAWDVDPGGAWYESSSDLLIAREDQIQSINANAMYLLWGEPSDTEFLMVGGRWEGWRTIESGFERQIATAAAVWRPGWWAERSLTFGSLLGAYVDDPYRTGQPYVAIFAAVKWIDESGL